MKATGIVRRIDDLGRVVIPKEIRRTMRIREGDPLEIFTDRDGEVIFKKYSPIGELLGFAMQYAETLYKTSNHPVVVCDRDTVVAFAGVPKKECSEKKISADVESVMESRQMYCRKNGSREFCVIDGNEKICYTNRIFKPYRKHSISFIWYSISRVRTPFIWGYL